MAETASDHRGGGADAFGERSQTELDLSDLAGLATELADLAAQSVVSRVEQAELLTRTVRLHDQLQRVIGSIADTADSMAAPFAVGENSVPALLRAACHTRASQSKQFLALGRSRHRFPTFAEAHRRGEITAGHVEVITDLASRVDTRQLGAAEPHLCAAAAASTVETFADTCREWEAAADPSQHLEEFLAAQARRHFVMANDLFGNLHLTGTLPPLEGETFQAIIDRHADSRFRADPGSGRHQRNVDALVDLVAKGHAADSDRKPEPVVHIMCSCGGEHKMSGGANHADDGSGGGVGVTTLAGEHRWRRHPQTLGGRLIPPSVISSMIRDGVTARRHRIRPDGSIVDHTIAGRAFTPRQQLLIDLRDQRCRHPGCRTPARFCDHDHVVPVSQGGLTTIGNGQLLCRFHHRWKHRNDPSPRSEAGGRPPP